MLETETTTTPSTDPQPVVTGENVDNIECCEVGLATDPMVIAMHNSDKETMLMACKTVDTFEVTPDTGTCVIDKEYLGRNDVQSGIVEQEMIPPPSEICCNAGFEMDRTDLLKACAPTYEWKSAEQECTILYDYTGSSMVLTPFRQSATKTDCCNAHYDADSKTAPSSDEIRESCETQTYSYDGSVCTLTTNRLLSDMTV